MYLLTHIILVWLLKLTEPKKYYTIESYRRKEKCAEHITEIIETAYGRDRTIQWRSSRTPHDHNS
jgi:hypothetical protein